MRKQFPACIAAAALVVLCTAGPAPAWGQELYDPAIWADDLAPGERLWVPKVKHSGTGHPQEWGYDILAQRHESGTRWSSRRAGRSGEANDAYVIYGKPVHAMAGGTVIACWRNAPENPRGSRSGDERSDYLHPRVLDDRIGLGGNFLWIEEDDGERVLYAHAIPGSIPARLCPHAATLFPAPYAQGDDQMPAASLVPAGPGGRPRVAAGDLLMRVGNSGNSTEPHLHIHKIAAGGAARQMTFRRGLFTPFPNQSAGLNGWRSHAGSPYPAGPVLLWPPRRVGSEYARHGLPAGDYERMFLHLSDSGYQLSWLDAYSVGGASFMNMVWHPARAHWSALHLATAADYQAAVAAAERDNADPVLVESSLHGGQVRYSAIFVRNRPGGWLARHGLTHAQHLEVMGQARSAGRSPASVSVVSVGGTRFYTVLYNGDDIGEWRVEGEVAEADFQRVVSARTREGLHLVYVNAYMHQGQPYLSAIFARKAGARVSAAHGLSASAYQDAYDQNTRAGLLTRAVTSFDGASSQHRHAAVWWRP
jgi:hypothetical protein